VATEHINEEEIFRNAIQCENREDQMKYVKKACGDNTDLLTAVETLLQHHYAYSILDAPAFEAVLFDENTAITEEPGSTIDRYKLLEKIGEGGMAVVYMAEQTEPIRRKVALKIIKLGMDTKSVIARFEAERQALAMMDHPNIAKVFDAGSTETGRPYFVMELVKGVSITEYCDRNNLNTAERLLLFNQVCSAIQHAHQKGIIHRDIKPSNVMVTRRDGTVVPKIIDFGIAKATNQRLTEKTLFTRYAQMIGTPAYMSPEQAELNDIDIDTRTDIYSLGVLLYELLTGTTPFSEEELRKAGYLGMQRIIREQEPTKPSTKLSTLGLTLTDVAKHRSATPELLTKTIRGDLDWIVMKSLEKQRERRYETTAELSADIVRHLNHQPVKAAAPSLSYKTRKFVRRHRIGVLVALLVGLAIIATLLVLSVSTILIWREQGRTKQALEREQKALEQETQARTEAELQTKIAQAVADFLNNDLLASVDPDLTRGRQVTVREILDAASQKIEGRFKDEPLIEASVRMTLGNAYTKLGEYVKAARQLERVRQLHQEHLPPEDPAALESMHALGWLYVQQHRHEEAEPLLVTALEISQRALGEEHPITLGCMTDLAALHEMQGRYWQAELLGLKAVELQKHVFGADHLSTLNTMNNLALLYVEQERCQEAETLYHQIIAIKQRQFGEDHPDTLRSNSNLAILFQRDGRYPEAESLNRRILEIRRRVLGENHPDTLSSMNNLGVVYHKQGRYGEAEPLFTKSLEIKGRVLGEDHPATLNSAHNLAALYKDQGRYEEGEQLYRRVVETRVRVLGESHPDTVKARNLLVGLYEAWGKPEEAAKWQAKLPPMTAESLPERPAPSFTLADVNGRQVSLSDLKGKVVLLDFWATWCSYCMTAIPYLEALHQKYGDEGLVVIGLNSEPNQARVKEFAENWMSYVVLPGADKQFMEYGVNAIPMFFYIDRLGVLRYRQSGFTAGQEGSMEGRIVELLDAGSDGDGVRPSQSRQAAGPWPAHASDMGLAPTVELRWMKAQDAVAYRVYFGPGPENLVLLGEVRDGNTIASPQLTKQRWYCWRVDTIRSDGSVVEGRLWSFSTGDLVGWWQFDETEGRVAVDSSGRGHHGSFIGNPQWQPGRIGGALAFDGQDDYILIKDVTDFSITKEITVACWINIARFDMPWQAIVAKGNQAWRIIRALDGRNIEFACTGVNVPNTPWGNVFGKAAVDDGQWHHLTGVYDGTRVCLYVDGVLDASVEGTGNINSNNDYVLIGANAGDQWRYWHGLIDDVRVYSYALSAEQIKELYAGRGPGPNRKPVGK